MEGDHYLVIEKTEIPVPREQLSNLLQEYEPYSPEQLDIYYEAFEAKSSVKLPLSARHPLKKLQELSEKLLDLGIMIIDASFHEEGEDEGLFWDDNLT